MTTTLTLIRAEPFTMRYDPPHEQMTEDEFFEFCQRNDWWHIERNVEGELVIMPPAGSETGERNSSLNALLWIWARADGTGSVFDSSSGFTLPSGAVRSPDAAWVRRTRWDPLSAEERRKFAPLCPDFVVELRSPSDDLETLKEKMAEYLANGALLGWLIDPEARAVWIYRPDAEVLCLQNPESVSGEPILPGFILEMRHVWS